MIETTISEINVSELMERIRSKAAEINKREPALPTQSGGREGRRLPPLAVLQALPALALPGRVDAKRARLLSKLERAGDHLTVSSWIPKMFRGLFRNQAGYNRLVLESIAAVIKTNSELANRLEQLTACVEQEHHWLFSLANARELDVKWNKNATTLIKSAAVELKRLEAHVETENDIAATRLDKGLAKARGLFGALDDQLGTLRSEMDRERRGTTENLAKLLSAANDLDVTVKKNQADHEKQLNALRNDHDRVAEQSSDQLKKLQAEFGSASEHLRNLQAELGSASEHLRKLQAEFGSACEHLRNLQAEVDRNTDARRLVTMLEERVNTDATFIKGELAHQRSLFGHMLMAKETKGKRNAPGPRAPKLPPNTSGNDTDAFYLSFEDRFRGPRFEIKRRISFYLPYLTAAGAGTSERPILDVGCGRGEWLELLRENELTARGVDLNAAMCAQCTERGLEVVLGDAIEHLRALPDDSHGAVSGFHIIEHLPFEVLLTLIRETRRVLKPGGIAIFESPNCKNLVVGASNFNIDPTHRNPVFPETAEFMLSIHGFERCEIQYLSPAEGSPFDQNRPEFAYLNERFFGPQDYGVIAYKPARQ